METANKLKKFYNAIKLFRLHRHTHSLKLKLPAKVNEVHLNIQKRNSKNYLWKKIINILVSKQRIIIPRHCFIDKNSEVDFENFIRKYFPINKR